MENRCPKGVKFCSDCPVQMEFCPERDERAGVEKLRKWYRDGGDPVMDELDGEPWWKGLVGQSNQSIKPKKR